MKRVPVVLHYVVISRRAEEIELQRSVEQLLSAGGNTSKRRSSLAENKPRPCGFHGYLQRLVGYSDRLLRKCRDLTFRFTQLQLIKAHLIACAAPRLGFSGGEDEPDIHFPARYFLRLRNLNNRAPHR